MTPLTKPVVRKSRCPHSRWKKHIVITLNPGDTVSVRLERDRKQFHLSLEQVYETALAAFARSLYAK